VFVFIVLSQWSGFEQSAKSPIAIASLPFQPVTYPQVIHNKLWKDCGLPVDPVHPPLKLIFQGLSLIVSSAAQ
jgi:hypothetical protein